MEILLVYAFIALTTAFTSLYEILMPVIRRRRDEGYDVDHKVITYLVFFVVSLVITPIMFLSCIIPSTGERFRGALYQGMYPEE